MSDRFVPTRFMASTSMGDGALLLYNSMTGAIGVVPVDKVKIVKNALKRNAHHTLPLEGILGDLKQGGFLVPEDTDETDALRQRYFATKNSDDYLNLIIMPTEECNFRCVYCYESFSRGKMTQDVISGIKRYIKRQTSLKRLMIGWFGGEPLLASDVVIELSQFFFEYCLEHDIDYAANMTTNGSLLKPEVADEILRYGVRSFQITLDGIPEEHNQRRVFSNGAGTFETILNNLRYLKSINYPFVVALRHNFDPKNLKSVNEFIDLLKTEFGGDPRFITMFRPISRLGGINDKDLSIYLGRPAKEAILKANQLAVNAGFRIAWPAIQLTPFSFVCYAAKPRSFVVGANGNIYKCTVELDSNDRNIVGHLHADGNMELDQQKMALWCETDGLQKDGKCTTCFFSPVCVGAICPKRLMDENNCECPAEKVLIGHTLQLIAKQNKLPAPPIVAPH